MHFRKTRGARMQPYDLMVPAIPSPEAKWEEKAAKTTARTFFLLHFHTAASSLPACACLSIRDRIPSYDVLWSLIFARTAGTRTTWPRVCG
jgi:hypothetical protein